MAPGLGVRGSVSLSPTPSEACPLLQLLLLSAHHLLSSQHQAPPFMFLKCNLEMRS